MLAFLLPMGFAGAATLINPTINNGSFEYVDGSPLTQPSGTKIVGWDTPGLNIDNWTLWSGPENDSGTQVWTPGPPPPQGPEGIWFAFLQPGASIYNLTGHTIQAGDTFTFSWDNIGTRTNLSHTVSLVFFDGTNVQVIPDTTVTGLNGGNAYGGTFTIPEGSLSIGHTIGLGVVNTSESWPELDNFVLEVTPVPEPSTLALAGASALFVITRAIRRRKAAR